MDPIISESIGINTVLVPGRALLLKMYAGILAKADSDRWWPIQSHSLFIRSIEPPAYRQQLRDEIYLLANDILNTGQKNV